MDMFSARRRIDTLEPWAKHINVLLLPIRSKRLITSCTSLLLLQTVFPAYCLSPEPGRIENRTYTKKERIHNVYVSCLRSSHLSVGSAHMNTSS